MLLLTEKQILNRLEVLVLELLAPVGDLLHADTPVVEFDLGTGVAALFLAFALVVKLVRDGNILAVGRWNDVGGAVNVFEYGGSNEDWALTEQIENAFDGTFADQYFGYSIALSNDANSLVVGHPGKFFSTSYYSDDDYAEEAPGITYIFQRSKMGKYVQKGGPIVGEYADNSGYRVSISDNGDIIALLSPYNNYARIFQFEGNEWVQLGSDIEGFFTSVSLSGTGLDLALDKSFSFEHVIYSYDIEAGNWKDKTSNSDSFPVEFGPDKQLVKYGNVNFKISKRGFSVSSDGNNVSESEGDITRVFTLVDNDDVNNVKAPKSGKTGKGKGGKTFSKKSSKGSKSGKAKKSSKIPKGSQSKGSKKSSKVLDSSKLPKIGKGKGGEKSSKTPKSSKGPKGIKSKRGKKSSKVPKSSKIPKGSKEKGGKGIRV